MGGLPPFVGFLAKEEIYYGLAKGDAWSVVFTIVAIVGNALMFVIGFAVALKPFLGPKVETPKHAHEGPVLLLAGPAVLALGSLFYALFSGWSHEHFSTPMASAVMGRAAEITITVIPHLGLALYLSLGTIAIGVLLYLSLAKIGRAWPSLLAAIGWGPDRGFDQAIAGIVKLSVAVTRMVQSAAASNSTSRRPSSSSPWRSWCRWASAGEWPAVPAFPELYFYEWLLVLIAVLGLFAVIWAQNRLTAIVSLGIQGFAVAVFFMLLGAPDLSFTQFMVETLSVVILALAMTRLRLSPQDHRSAVQTVTDGAIALVVGGALTLLVATCARNEFRRLADRILQRVFAADRPWPQHRQRDPGRLPRH